MVLVRANNGVHIKFKNPLTDFDDEEQDVNAIFFLVSPEKDPTQHLRILAQIAGRVEEESFAEEWKAAKDDQEIKEALLHEDRCLSIIVDGFTNTAPLLNKQLKEDRISGRLSCCYYKKKRANNNSQRQHGFNRRG